MAMTTDGLRPVPAEAWGSKLRRTRGKIKGEAVAEVISRLMRPITYNTVYRLEKENPELPLRLADRQVAIACALLYGYDPADLDLDVNELPELVDASALIRAGELLRSMSKGTCSFDWAALDHFLSDVRGGYGDSHPPFVADAGERAA